MRKELIDITKSTVLREGKTLYVARVLYTYPDAPSMEHTTHFYGLEGIPVAVAGVRAVFGPFDVLVDLPQRFGEFFNESWVFNYFAPYTNH